MNALRAFGRAIRQFHRDERGQAMTEAAIILPIFITTVAMTLEMCVLSTVKSVVNYGAYAACRAGIVHNADSEWMIYAAAMAISPVTQSSFVNTKMLTTGDDFLGIEGYRTYGTWEWEGDKDRRAAGDGKQAVSYAGATFKSETPAIRTVKRTGNFVLGTGIAILQFNKLFSMAEYLMLSDIEGLLGDISSLGSMIGNIDSLSDLEDIIDQVNIIVATVSAIDDTPINRLQVIRSNPADSEEVAAETGEFTGLFGWGEIDVNKLGGTVDADLLTETGAKKEGVSFIAVLGKNPNAEKEAANDSRRKALRLHIRLIHRHALIFPFLKMVYRNVIERRDTSDEEDEIIGLANLVGMVEIWGDCVMNMQSNLTLEDD